MKRCLLVPAVLFCVIGGFASHRRCGPLAAEGLSVAERPSVESLFPVLCSRTDRSFKACRDLVIQQGRTATPFLKGKLANGSPEERLAAEDAILAITQPENVERWRRGLQHGAERVFRDDRTVVAVVEDKDGRKQQIIYGREAVPWLVANVWLAEWTVSAEARGRRVGTLYRMLSHIGDDRVIHTLVFRAPCIYAREAWESALAGFGSKAVPELREYLRGTTGVSTRRAASVASVLGRIGDRAAVPELKRELLEGWYDVATASASALCRMKAPEAAETIWPVLMELAANKGKGRHAPKHREGLRYPSIRNALGLLGEDLIPFVKAKRAAADDRLTRAVCDGILARFEKPEEFAALLAEVQGNTEWMYWREPYAIGPAKMNEMAFGFLIEEAYVLRNQRALAPLGGSGNARAFEAIAANLDDHPVEAIAALGDLGDPRAIDRLLPTATGDRPYNTNAAWSIFRIGGPAAARALREVARRNETLRSEATAYADLIDGNRQQALRLLESEDKRLRSAAACGLVARGEAEALPIFLDYLGTLRGQEYVRLRPLLTALGQEGLGPLKKELSHDDWRHRLPAESAIIEIERPAAFQACRKHLRQGVAQIAGMHVYVYSRVDGAARQVAEKVEAVDAPFFEEAMYFGSSESWGLSASVAAAVLGYLKQQRSLEALSASAKMPGFRGVSPVFEALKKYGRAGAEIARQLPDPNPDRARFGARSRRAVRAADMLAGRDHDASVDKLLGWHAAWRAASADSRKQMSLEQFLLAAAKVPDPKLLPILLEVYAHTSERTRVAAAVALESYDDPRAVPLILEAIPCGNDNSMSLPALQALTLRVGDRAPEMLVEGLADLEPLRASAVAEAVAALVNSTGWHPEAYDTPEKVEAAAAVARRTALPRLYRALEHPESELSAAVAFGLRNLHDAETAKRIGVWVAEGGNLLWIAPGKRVSWYECKICHYLERQKPEAARPGVLEAFRKAPSNCLLIRLVGAYRIESTTARLQEFLRVEPAYSRSSRAAASAAAATALRAMGPAGLDALAEIAQGDGSIAGRLRAAGELASRADPRVLDPVIEILDELLALDTAHPALAKTEELYRRKAIQRWMDTIIEVLALRGGQRGRQLLRRLGALHPDPAVRSRALWRLGMMPEERP